jgi:hypothetical protein
MQPTNRNQHRSIQAVLGRLFRAVGRLDATPASVKNSKRRLPQARAALDRLQGRMQAAEPFGSLG